MNQWFQRACEGFHSGSLTKEDLEGAATYCEIQIVKGNTVEDYAGMLREIRRFLSILNAHQSKEASL